MVVLMKNSTTPATWTRKGSRYVCVIGVRRYSVFKTIHGLWTWNACATWEADKAEATEYYNTLAYAKAAVARAHAGKEPGAW